MASITTNSSQKRSVTLEVWGQETDIANNRSRYSWKLKSSGDRDQYYYVMGRKFTVNVGGHQVAYYGADIQLFRDTVIGQGTTPWIGHNSDGSKTVSMSVTGAIYTHAVNVSASGSFTATRIPRAATVTGGSNFNDEQNPTINYSNPAGNAVQELVAGLYIGSTAMASYRGVSKTGTSYTFSLTEAERNILRNSTNTMSDPKQTVRFILRTKIGDVFYYSEVNRTGSVVNYNPSISPAYHWNNNASHVTLTGSNQKYIKGYSSMSVGLATANFVVRKGATKRTLSFSNSGVTKTANVTGAHVEMSLSGAVNNTALSVTGTDSRGKAVTAQTSTVQLVNFNRCTITKAEAYRTSGTGTTATLRVEGTWHDMSFGAKRNVIAAQYRWRHSGSSWSSWNNFPKWTTTGGKFVGIYDTGSWVFGTAYEVQFIARDTITAVESSVCSITSGEPTLALDTANKSLGVGLLPDAEKGSIRCKKVHSDYLLSGTRGIVTEGGLVVKGNATVNGSITVDGKGVPTYVASKHLNFNSVDGFIGIDNNSSSYLRTPTYGLIPHRSGVHGNIGTTAWRFNECYINYGNFTSVSINGAKVQHAYGSSEIKMGHTHFGNPIYARSFSVSGNGTTQGSVYIPMNLAGIHDIIDVQITAYTDNYTRLVQVPFSDFDPDWSITALVENPKTSGSNGVRVYTRRRSLSWIHVTVYYSK